MALAACMNEANYSSCRAIVCRETLDFFLTAWTACEFFRDDLETSVWSFHLYHLWLDIRTCPSCLLIVNVVIPLSWKHRLDVDMNISRQRCLCVCDDSWCQNQATYTAPSLSILIRLHMASKAILPTLLFPGQHTTEAFVHLITRLSILWIAYNWCKVVASASLVLGACCHANHFRACSKSRQVSSLFLLMVLRCSAWPWISSCCCDQLRVWGVKGLETNASSGCENISVWPLYSMNFTCIGYLRLWMKNRLANIRSDSIFWSQLGKVKKYIIPGKL